MFMSVFSLPFSIARMLVKSSPVSESKAFRTDKLAVINEDLHTEFFCNAISNLSSISASPGSEYFTPSMLFSKYFKEV